MWTVSHEATLKMNAVKILYYITFLFALGAFIMLSTSLPTEYMVTATIVNSEGQTTGSINFGIFRGSKLLTTDDAGASEVKEFLGEWHIEWPVWIYIFTKVVVLSGSCYSKAPWSYTLIAPSVCCGNWKKCVAQWAD